MRRAIEHPLDTVNSGVAVLARILIRRNCCTVPQVESRGRVLLLVSARVPENPARRVGRTGSESNVQGGLLHEDRVGARRELEVKFRGQSVVVCVRQTPEDSDIRD